MSPVSSDFLLLLSFRWRRSWNNSARRAQSWSWKSHNCNRNRRQLLVRCTERWKRYGVPPPCRSHRMTLVGTEHWWSINLNNYFKSAVSKDQVSLWSVGIKTQNFQACNQLRVFIFFKNPVIYAWTHIVLSLTEQWGKCSCTSLKSGNTWPQEEQHVGYHPSIRRMT